MSGNCEIFRKIRIYYSFGSIFSSPETYNFHIFEINLENYRKCCEFLGHFRPLRQSGLHLCSEQSQEWNLKNEIFFAFRFFAKLVPFTHIKILCFLSLAGKDVFSQRILPRFTAKSDSQSSKSVAVSETFYNIIFNCLIKKFCFM